MEEQSKGDSTTQIFSIIGFVLAIFSLIFSFIPCIGFYAFVPALLAAIFSFIAFRQQRINREANGLSLAGMIIGLVALLVAIYQYVQFNEAFGNKKKLDKSLDKIFVEAIEKSLKQQLKQDSIDRAQQDTVTWEE